MVPTVKVEASVDGVDAVLRSLDALGERLTDLRPVFTDVADDFHRMESRLFASHGGSAGEPWASSASGSPVTLEGRRAKMRRSLTTPRVNGAVQRITRNSVTLGSTHPLAHVHQGGTGARYVKTYKGKPLAKPRYAGSLPRRAVFNVGETDIARWHTMISDYVTSETTRLGL
jgi:phage gpG-like protein